MSHEVETMMYAGDVPWHGLGNYVGDNPVNSKEAIVAAELGWKVEKQPMFLQDGTESKISKAIVRESDGRELGNVGFGYEPYQNVEAFEFLDSLVDEGLMRYHTAGSLRGGQRIFLLGKIGDTEILPDDKVDQYLLCYNSHDGSSLLRALFTAVRVVCANTCSAALQRGKGDGVALRHTKNMRDRLDEGKKVLGLAHQEFDKHTEFAKKLTQLKMPIKRWDTFTETLIPDNPEAKHNTRAENARETLTELFEIGRGTEIKGVKGTGWGAYGAVVEYANYRRSSRGGDEAQARRFESSLFGNGAQFIQKGTQLLQGYLQEAA